MKKRRDLKIGINMTVTDKCIITFRGLTSLLFRAKLLIGVEFDDLDEAEQNKDVKPMQLLIKLINQFDGLRIYKLN